MNRPLVFLLLLSITACSPSPSKVITSAPTPTSQATAPTPTPIPTPTPTGKVAEPAKPAVEQARGNKSTADSATNLEPANLSLGRQQTTLTAQELGSRINVRDGASPSAYARHYGYAGDPVLVLDETQGGDGKIWYQVRFTQSGATGWVRGDFVARSPDAIPSPSSSPQIGSPLREGTTGQGCECPYDNDKAGRSCGARSAYSRPGGSAPACYVGDN